MNVQTQERKDRLGRFLDKGGKTPLHIAAKNNLKAIGELLILKGAEINAVAIIYLNI